MWDANGRRGGAVFFPRVLCNDASTIGESGGAQSIATQVRA
jgi:hypothetical protein